MKAYVSHSTGDAGYNAYAYWGWRQKVLVHYFAFGLAEFTYLVGRLHVGESVDLAGALRITFTSRNADGSAHVQIASGRRAPHGGLQGLPTAHAEAVQTSVREAVTLRSP